MKLQLAPELGVTRGSDGWRIWIAGEPGSGKSWCSFGIASQVVQADGQVVVLDTHGDYGPLVLVGDVALVGYRDGATPDIADIPAYVEAIHHGASVSFDLSVWSAEKPKHLDVFVAALLRGLYAMQRRRSSGRVLLIAEEAQNICPQVRSQGQMEQVRTFATIATEGRKFGLDFMLTAQRPSLVDKSAISACNLRVFLRHSDWEEWDRIRSYGLDRFVDYERIRHFANGEAIVLTRHQDGLFRLARPFVLPGMLPGEWVGYCEGASAAKVRRAVRDHAAGVTSEPPGAEVIPFRLGR